MFKRLLTCFLLLSGVAHAGNTTVIVLDASGSMNDGMQVRGGTMSRMDVAKESLKRVLPKTPQDTDLGILVFSSSNLDSSQEWIYPIGKPVRDKLIQAIDRPMPGGRTPIGDYAKIGGDKLLERRQKSGNSGVYRLVIVTDGENTAGVDPETIIKDAKRKGIIVDLIGLGIDSEHSLAQIVRAYPTPGTYQSAQNADQFVEAVSNAIKEAPVTDSGNIAPEIFEETAGLDSQIAAKMLNAVSIYNNTPLGDPDPEITVDEKGTMQMSAPIGTPPDGGDAPGLQGVNILAWILVIAFLLIFVVIILAMIMSS